MDRSEQRESQMLRERLSRLSAASRRINESLDFDRVLQGALDSARSLTGARIGVMTQWGGRATERRRIFRTGFGTSRPTTGSVSTATRLRRPGRLPA